MQRCSPPCPAPWVCADLLWRLLTLSVQAVLMRRRLVRGKWPEWQPLWRSRTPQTTGLLPARMATGERRGGQGGQKSWLVPLREIWCRQASGTAAAWRPVNQFPDALCGKQARER